MIIHVFSSPWLLQGSDTKSPIVIRIVGERGYRGEAGAVGPSVSLYDHKLANMALLTVMTVQFWEGACLTHIISSSHVYTVCMCDVEGKA